MIDHPACPVCGADDWETISCQTYRRRARSRSAYAAHRLELLFELWAPGRESLTTRYLLCRRCGLVIYSPRPSAEEVAAKYARFGGASSSTVERPRVTPVDRRRSREIFDVVGPSLPEGAAVLDFGGGTGGLMASFVDRGAACAVVDYAVEAVPGVERIARTIDEVPADRRFDLVVASHVIEHAPAPLDVLRALARRLCRGGILYVEVPLELLGGPPRRDEPMTHINFFAEPSLRELLLRSGLAGVRCWTAASTHASGKLAPAIRAVASRGETGKSGETVTPHPARPAAEVRRLIEGGAAARAAFRLRHPATLLNPLWRLRARAGW